MSGKARSMLSVLLVVTALPAVAATAPKSRNPFEKNLAAPSQLVRFLAAEQAAARARAGLAPAAFPPRLPVTLDVIRPDAESVATPSGEMPGSLVSRTQDVTSCSPATGGRFNREPAADALPQVNETVDFFPGSGISGADLVVAAADDFRGFYVTPSNPSWGGTLTGYYVARGTACAPDFEGPAPLLDLGNEALLGGGSPAVAADILRSAAFLADLRFSPSRSGVGLFRTTVARLASTAFCPNGTHDPDAASGCWPTGIGVGLRDASCFFVDRPHIAVDGRASGTGSGNVYVTATEFDRCMGGSRIWLVACNNDLSLCSDPVIVSGSDDQTQNSYVAVRPDGGVTLTYVNVGAGFFDINYVACSPTAAPAAPSCGAPGLVRHEIKPLRVGSLLGAQDFQVSTFPKHDHRTDENGIETYVVWDRCATQPTTAICPRSEIMMRASSNNGSSWSPLVFIQNDPPGDRFFPAIRTDRATNTVALAYYSAESDSLFNRRLQVNLSTIFPGGATPDPIGAPFNLTTQRTEPAADPLLGGTLFGEQIGVVARSSKAYVSFTFNTATGLYSGLQLAEKNNHLTVFPYVVPFTVTADTTPAASAVRGRSRRTE